MQDASIDAAREVRIAGLIEAAGAIRDDYYDELVSGAPLDPARRRAAQLRLSAWHSELVRLRPAYVPTGMIAARFGKRIDFVDLMQLMWLLSERARTAPIAVDQTIDEMIEETLEQTRARMLDDRADQPIEPTVDEAHEPTLAQPIDELALRRRAVAR